MKVYVLGRLKEGDKLVEIVSLVGSLGEDRISGNIFGESNEVVCCPFEIHFEIGKAIADGDDGMG